MKIALAQISTRPGKIEENTAKIVSYIEQASAAGAELVVFPELAIPGYAIMDLAFSTSYIAENKNALDKIVAASKNIAVIVGFIDFDPTKKRAGNRPALYNCAAVIENGKLIGVQDKTLLPNYDIFFEDRYFSTARDTKVFKVKGETLGVQICEDLWDEDYPVKVTENLLKLKAEIIINISASPFNTGKLQERYRVISKLAQTHKTCFVYTNLVGSFDGFDGETVFDGQSLVLNKDADIIAQAQAFREELLVLDLSKAEKRALTPSSPEGEIHDALILGIRDFFGRLGVKKAYLGLSGGIDSAVVAALASEALGKENVIALTMPSHITSGETLNDAKKLAHNFGISLLERPIVSEYQAWLKEFTESNGQEPSKLTRQNKQARIRGSMLMAYSNHNADGLVLSTGNKTELALGYCTLYGDMCGALAVISDLSKVRVYALARYINEKNQQELIPQTTIDRIPTAELEENQTDRANLPADYPVISPLVESIIEENYSLAELEAKYGAEIVQKTIKLINQNEFKRRQAAPGIRITKRAFGIGRRIPMAI